jgi:hypothetical protein
LTQAGYELTQVCKSQPIGGFFEFIYDRWAEQGYVPKRTSEQDGQPPGPTGVVVFDAAP